MGAMGAVEMRVLRARHRGEQGLAMAGGGGRDVAPAGDDEDRAELVTERPISSMSRMARRRRRLPCCSGLGDQVALEARSGRWLPGGEKQARGSAAGGIRDGRGAPPRGPV